ncbi:MAG: helix-turn-helix domain-containing protein [bacterium]|nr:helix-turn-helix domain-containing protein [bacterium]
MAKNNIQQLLKLGFSESDARVYLALAELKTSSVSPIITNTGLHRSLVYTALEHLVSRKLISEFENRGKKHFSIASPAKLTEEFFEKQEIAHSVAQDIKKQIDSGTQEITVHKGNEEYLSLLVSMARQSSRHKAFYVLGTGGEDFMTETMRPIWKKYHKAVRESEISIKMIAYKNQKDSFQTEIVAENAYQVRYLPSDLKNPAGIHIYPGAGVVLNIIYSDINRPVTAIKIKDQYLVKGYLNLFNSLWKEAKHLD